jgi:pimeloyl-ACP methyl ester carboxylesterase
VSPARNRPLTGLGLGLVAAGAAAAAGVATERLRHARTTARALDSGDSYEGLPDEELVVIADDGVPLHVEIDQPERRPEGMDEHAPVPTVVLSHGYTLNLKSWVFQRRALRAAGYRVVLWDQRGHGRSGSGSAGSYDIDQLGRDLAEVIGQAVPEGPLVLVGHSMGGMTIMSLAVEHHALIRDRFVGVAFVATSPGGLSGVSWGMGNLLGKLVRRVGPVAMGRLADRDGLVSSARRAGKNVEDFLVDRYSFASPVPQNIVRMTADMILGTRLDVISHFVPTFDRHDKRDALEQFIGIETLVLNGAQDLLTPAEHSEEIVRLVPGSEHVVVNDAGHIIMLEHPDVVSEQLLALIERAVRAGAQDLDVTRKPRVRRTVTDLAKKRRVSRAQSRRRRHAS